MIALEATGLGRRYGRNWGLRDCSLSLAQGRIVGLVGANGAGKSTLLHLAVGLMEPSAGRIEVLGWSPTDRPVAVLSRTSFVAQDRPLYRGFRVAEMLELGRRLNPRWDQALAADRLRHLEIPLERRVGQLSGGQQSQVALTMALGKRPDLLLLDEPVANLDPLGRRAFLQSLGEAAADGVTVVISSHLVADLERICDHLVLLGQGRVQIAADVDELMGSHRILVGPRQEAEGVAAGATVIQASQTDRQSTLLVRNGSRSLPSSWQVHEPPLEDLILAYLRNPSAGSPGPVHLDTTLGGES